MQTNRIQRCTGLLCAAVFAVAALSGTASPSVRAAASGENVTGDLLEMQGIPLDAGSWQAICAAARDVGLSESHFDRCRPLA